MQLHLLLTSDIAETKPESCKIIHDFGNLTVFFEDNKTEYGLHCIVEDTKENIINWLKPFDRIVKGSGTPMFEQFEIVHISENFK